MCLLSLQSGANDAIACGTNRTTLAIIFNHAGSYLYLLLLVIVTEIKATTESVFCIYTTDTETELVH